jgi:hypothetical protein
LACIATYLVVALAVAVVATRRRGRATSGGIGVFDALPALNTEPLSLGSTIVDIVVSDWPESDIIEVLDNRKNT